MSLSDDDPKSPTDENRAGTNQEPRESPKESSFLSSKETDKKIMSSDEDFLTQDSRKITKESSFLRSKEPTEMSLSDDDPKSPTDESRARTNQEPRESPKESSFLSSKETDKKIMSSDEDFSKSLSNELLETSPSSVSPMNNVEEPLKSENPSYFESHKMSTIQIMPTSGDVRHGMEQEMSLSNDPTSLTEKNQEQGESPQDSSFLSSEETENLLNPSDDILRGNMASQIDPEPIKMMPNNISPGTYKSSEPKNEEEIKMIPTPGYFKRSQWIIKKILNKGDVDAKKSRLKMHKSLCEEHLKKQLPEAKFEELKSNKDGINVMVYDYDSDTKHELRLTLRRSSFHLMGGWGNGFIKRKSLKEGQEIGLLYDPSFSVLYFSVLNLETASVPAKD